MSYERFSGPEMVPWSYELNKVVSIVLLASAVSSRNVEGVPISRQHGLYEYWDAQLVWARRTDLGLFTTMGWASRMIAAKGSGWLVVKSSSFRPLDRQQVHIRREELDTRAIY